MRKALGELGSEKRYRFRATVSRFGSKPGWCGSKQKTVLLKNIRLGSRIVADHLWFTVGKSISELWLVTGDVIEFDARVGQYIKNSTNEYDGSTEQRVEYCLVRPTKFTVIKRVGVTSAA